MSKSIKVYQETTTWADGMNANHIYVFTEKPSGRTASAIAYIPAGSNTVQKFKKPLVLDLKNRSFEELTQ